MTGYSAKIFFLNLSAGQILECVLTNNGALMSCGRNSFSFLKTRRPDEPRIKRWPIMERQNCFFPNGKSGIFPFFPVFAVFKANCENFS